MLIVFFDNHNLHSHCFQDSVHPLSDCCKDIGSVTHFFLQCTNFYIRRQTLFQNIRNIGEQILSRIEQITQIFLFYNRNYNLAINRLLTNSANDNLSFNFFLFNYHVHCKSVCVIIGKNYY